ncbi:MAG: ABC transporter substrate-binding protein [Hyphomicrobiales bacterium]|nr:MAG: ABC transporter substrate-binding protein [Hyphomicrobiales bacterium]
MSVSTLTPKTTPDVFYTVCPVPSAISIALGRGTLQADFARNGVPLTNVRTHADRNVRESHYDQTQANLFREGGNIPPLWSRSVGRDVRLIGVSWVEHYAALVALPGSGIRTPADLKGKRVGLVNRPNDRIDFTRATQLRGYLVALAAGGVSRGDVTFVDLTYDKPLVALPPESQALSSSAFGLHGVRERQSVLIKALLEGTVDALYLTGPGAEVAAFAGAGIVYDVAQALDPIDRVSNLTPVTFTVKGELLDSHPEVVADYLAANLRTARWARENPQDAARYIGRDTGIPEEAVALSYSSQVAAQLETSLDPELVARLEVQKNFLLDEGFLGGDFNFSDFVAPGPLERARQIVAAEGAVPLARSA